MRLEHKAVSTYIQTFVLVAIALAGSAAVYRVVQGYSSAAGGASISVLSGSIRQASGVGVETVALSDTGQTSLGPIILLTPGALSSADYCYSVWNPASQSVLADTCPTMTAGPQSIQTGVTLQPGGSAIIEVTVSGSAFTIGRTYDVTVVAQGGAVASSPTEASSA